MRIIKIFVSSPGDVSDERNIVKQIVDELNLTLPEILGATLRLISWEKDVYPGFGNYPQDVVNKEVGNEYDVFLGIIWKKFGTPTPNAKSGTEEEFLMAYKKFKQNPTSFHILFYFKNASIPISEIDVEQITKIHEFKIELGEKGGLYKEFNNTQDFEQLLRVHLIKVAKDLLNVQKDLQNQSLAVSEKNTETEEVGILDNIIIGEEAMTNLTGSLNNITEELSSITRKTQATKEKIERINSSGTPSQKANSGKTLIDSFADDMLHSAKRIENEVSIFHDYGQKGFYAFTNAILPYVRLGEIDENIDIAIESLKTLKLTISDARVEYINLKNTISEVIGLTTNYNKAKRKYSEVIDLLIQEFDSVVNIINEFESNI